jgi:hypothetical protein
VAASQSISTCGSACSPFIFCLKILIGFLDSRQYSLYDSLHDRLVSLFLALRFFGSDKASLDFFGVLDA